MIFLQFCVMLQIYNICYLLVDKFDSLPPRRYLCRISQWTKAPFFDKPVTLGRPIGVPVLATLETRKC